MALPAHDLLSDRLRKYLKHPRDWAGIVHMLSVEPDTVDKVIDLALSPTPQDVLDASYWYVLSRVVERLPDPEPVVDIYLRFAPDPQRYVPAYFSTLCGLMLYHLSWKHVLRIYNRLKDRGTFWRCFSIYLGNRPDRKAYELILKHADDPLLRPYLWKTVERYVQRDGYRSPELLIALSHYADEPEYWRVLKRYLRRHPEYAPYILLRIPSGFRHYLFIVFALAKRFPRQLYPVVRELARSGEHSRIFFDALAALHRRYPHVYSDLLPTCPNCGHEMFFDGQRFVCPECEYHSDADPESGTFR